MGRTKEKIDKLQEELVSVQRELESVRTDFTKLSSLDFSGCNQVDGEKIGFDGEEEKIPEISDSFQYDGNREVVESGSVQNESLYTFGSNQDVGVMDGNDFEEKITCQNFVTGTLRDKGSREDLQSHSLKVSGTLRDKGSREVMQSHGLKVSGTLRDEGSREVIESHGLKVSGTLRDERSREVMQSQGLKVSGTLRDKGSREVMRPCSDRKLSIDMFDLTHDRCNDENLTEYYHAQGARLPPDWNPNIPRR